MRSICCLKFTIAALVVMVPTLVLAVEDVSPRVQLGRIATYGYDDAGDSSSNPVYLTPKPLRFFPTCSAILPIQLAILTSITFPAFTLFPARISKDIFPAGCRRGHRIVRRAERFKILERRRSGGVQCRSGRRNVSAFAVLEFDDHRHGASFYPGFNIQSVDALGGMHRHLNAELQAGTNTIPADGIYLFEMRLKLSQSDGTPYPGITPSLPFFLMYENNANNDIAMNAYQEAQDWVKTNLVPFGDFNRDHKVDAADLPAMLAALADLKTYQAVNQLSDFELQAFGDIDSDGKITNADIQSFLNLLSSGAAMQLVPEPAAWMLFVTGFAILGLRFHRVIVSRGAGMVYSTLSIARRVDEPPSQDFRNVVSRCHRDGRRQRHADEIRLAQSAVSRRRPADD